MAIQRKKMMEQYNVYAKGQVAKHLSTFKKGKFLSTINIIIVNFSQNYQFFVILNANLFSNTV